MFSNVRGKERKKEEIKRTKEGGRKEERENVKIQKKEKSKKIHQQFFSISSTLSRHFVFVFTLLLYLLFVYFQDQSSDANLTLPTSLLRRESMIRYSLEHLRSQLDAILHAQWASEVTGKIENKKNG